MADDTEDTDVPSRSRLGTRLGSGRRLGTVHGGRRDQMVIPSTHRSIRLSLRVIIVIE